MDRLLHFDWIRFPAASITGRFNDTELNDMTTRSTFHAYGAALFMMLFAACASESSIQAPVATDAGDAGDRDVPLLPPECDKAPPATSTGAGPLLELAHFEHRIRASGNTIYYHRAGGIHAIQVPGGTGNLLVPYPLKARGADAATRLSSFDDFWVDAKSVIGADKGALYTAPSAGGTAELLPGYDSDSSSPWEGGEISHYARSREHVYRIARVGESSAAIERLPLAGGPRSTFVSLHGSFYHRGSRPGPIVIGGQSLYFLDREEGDEEGTASIFATPLDASAPVPVARHLRYPRLLGMVDGILYFADQLIGRGQLWRLGPDSSLEKVTLPGNVGFSVSDDGNRFVSVNGVGYVNVYAHYRLPNDAGTTLRDAVVRIRSDNTTAEIAHCFPDWTGGAPRDEKVMFFVDLAASDSRLYFALSLQDRTNGTWDDQILDLDP